MGGPAIVVHRRIIDRHGDELIVTEDTHSVDADDLIPDAVTCFAATPSLCEVGPGELVIITCDEAIVTPSELASQLVFFEPDHSFTGLDTLEDAVLAELFGDGDDPFGLDGDYWDRIDESVIRQPVLINGRTFLGVRDLSSQQVYVVESHSISENERPSLIYTPLVGVGIYHESGVTSGVWQWDLGTTVDGAFIETFIPDEGEIYVRVFMVAPAERAENIARFVTSVWDSNCSNMLLEALIGELPTADLIDISARWVNTAAPENSLITVKLGTDLASGPLRDEVVKLLRNPDFLQHADSVSVDFISAIVDPSSDHHAERLHRHHTFQRNDG